MMRIYEIWIPELDLDVRFKMLPAEELDSLFAESERLSREDYARIVIENVVDNLKPDVTRILRDMSKTKAFQIVNSIYNGAIMLNPPLDPQAWIKMTEEGTIRNPKERSRSTATTTEAAQKSRIKSRKMSKTKFLGLSKYLQHRVVGQDEAVKSVLSALKRSLAGLNDENRPLGVFFFAGASGVGKTHLAKALHDYLYGTEHRLVRVDCGEYQHKHENQKLLGAPPGYLGHDEGGHLTNQMQKCNGQTVVLLDEVEKAHPDMWHTFLRVFDEGFLTDGQGKEVDFRDAIIIMTTNLGNASVAADLQGRQIGFGTADPAQYVVRQRIERLANDEIRKHFAPEFLNRIDQVVVFNHLTDDAAQQIAALEIEQVNEKLLKKGFSLQYDNTVVAAMVADGINPIKGARGLAKMRRDKIEDPLADLLIKNSYPRGTVFEVSYSDDKYLFSANKPVKKVSEEVTI